MKLYEFKLDCGRMGFLDGLFVAEDSEVKELEGKYIYFGEALGKHSEISVLFSTKHHLTVKSEDEEFIKKLVDLMEDETISGYNPLEYYDPEEYEDEDDDEDE